MNAVEIPACDPDILDEIEAHDDERRRTGRARRRHAR